MSRPIAKRIMDAEEFNNLTASITGAPDRWLDRMHDLTLIDKPTLLKYSTGERAIANSHALFLRQMYLLQKAFPDLASDIIILMRQKTSEGHSLPAFEEVRDTANMVNEMKTLRKTIKKISKIASEVDKAQ